METKEYPTFEVRFKVWTKMTKEEFIEGLLSLVEIGIQNMDVEDRPKFLWDLASTGGN